MNNGAGYKTRQRQAILDFLIEKKDEHVTVQNISEHLEKDGSRVGVTTIYRHLDKLLEQGFVRKYTVDGSTSACFQFADPGKKCREHFHLKCESCGRLIHLNCSRTAGLCSHIFDEHGFEIDFFRTVFYGLCKECRIKKTEEKA